MTGGGLIVIAEGREHRFAPGRPVVIGRAEDCDVVIVDPRVSRRHLELVGEDGWVVQDLGTANGTWHARVRMTARPVGPGLACRLGDPDEGPEIKLIIAGDEPHRTQDLGAGEPGPAPVRLGERVTIGRADDNDIVLDDLLVSRWHARVVRTDRGHIVQDLGSANLTFVNGHPVTAAPLADGDVLTCGQTRMVRVGEELYPLPGGGHGGLSVDEVDCPGLVSQLSLRLSGRSLQALVGPAGSGKSTLLRLLTGEVRPTAGRVLYQGLDVHADRAVRTRIGLVPQHSVIHPRLTVRQALRDAADLRLPMDTPRADRDARIREVLEELDLTEHADVRVDRLGGDRPRRLAIGIELLTRPTLLLLEEPAAGLDPAQARSIMLLARRVADAGRQVVLTTHSPGDLGDCDTVLVLGPNGRQLFHGAPRDVEVRFGTADWAVIFDRLASTPVADPVEPPPNDPPVPAMPPWDRAARRRARYQAGIVARRQLRLLMAEWRHAVSLLLLPLVIAVLAVITAQRGGLAGADALHPLTVLVIGASAAAALTPLRTLVAERPAYTHERAAGLLPEAYLAGTALVFAGLAVFQALLAAVLVLAALPGPADAVLLGLPGVELAVGLGAVAVTGCCVGLAISAFAATREHTPLPLLVATTVQMFLCGGLVTLHGRPVPAAVAALTPARWGYAALASTAGIPGDVLWRHTPGIWLLDLCMGLLLGLACAGLALWRLRR